MASEFERVQQFFAALEGAPLQEFPASGARLNVPETHGVYAIYGRRGVRVLHVGRTVTGTKGLRQRLSNHLYGRSSFVTLHFDRDATRVRGLRFKYVEVKNPRIRALVEAYAIGQYCPSHIGYARSLLEAKQLEKGDGAA